jgi:hypothetical protein
MAMKQRKKKGQVSTLLKDTPPTASFYQLKTLEKRLKFPKGEENLPQDHNIDSPSEFLA